MPAYLYVLIALLTLIVPCFLGAYLGKKLRMPEHGWKFGLILFSVLASAVVLCLGPPLKFGVDLRGGAILVYEIDKSKTMAGEAVNMEKLIAAVSRRVNPGGQKEVTIRPCGVDQVEVIIPEVDDAELARVEKIISRTGTLEFRIIANQRDHKTLIERGLAEPTSKKTVLDASGNLLGMWVPVQPGRESEFLRDAGEIATRTIERAGKPVLEVLVVKDDQDVTGQYLVRAERDIDQKTASACVSFTFNPMGAQLFGKLTTDNQPDLVQGFKRKLGILLDGELYSAPGLESAITEGHGQITGISSEEQIKEEVDVLNAGSLPAALTKEPISRLYSGPTLGKDTITKSRDAMLIACILVPAFMLVYYRFAGVVADIALVLNMVMLVAIMVAIKAAFTLTGLAGLALTVGMAVDNNVLVYERLREEMERGATLRMAIRNAFHRAGATIIDCNVTHLLAATVLYVVGTDQLRGFAVTLWLGVAISMYTSVFVARVIFEVVEKRQWLTQLKMLHMIRHTNIDFMGWFRVCATASILITVLGLAIAIHRGQGLFDIDFTGGVSVQAQFNEPQDTGAVRSALSKVSDAERLPDLAISDVRIANEQPGLQFVINTSEPDLKKVQKALTDAFGDKLARNELTFSEPTLIEAKVAGKKTAEKPAADQPAAEKPATEIPAENKPAPAPGNPPQSRADLPSDRLLAMAGRESVLLALADAPAEKPKSAAKQVPAAADVAPAGEPATSPPPATQPTKTVPKRPTEKPAAMPAGEQPAAPDNAAPVQPVEPAKAFVGGSESELVFKTKLKYKDVEDRIKEAIETTKVSNNPVALQLLNPEYVEGEARPFSKWTVMMQLPPERAKQVLDAVREHLHATPFFPASSTIGGAVAKNTQVIAIYALIASWTGIVIYLWVRFQGVAFGLAAVLSLIHDVFVMLGAVAVSYYVPEWLGGWLMIEPFKINLPIIAAFLTIIGYSVNDTIVVFDRIREVRGKDPDLTRKMVNDSTNQTMSRTLLTSVTVLLVVVVLYLFGGDALHGFAFSLIIGVLTGTYSSIYVAAPTLQWMVHYARKSKLAT